MQRGVDDSRVPRKREEQRRDENEMIGWTNGWRPRIKHRAYGVDAEMQIRCAMVDYALLDATARPPGDTRCAARENFYTIPLRRETVGEEGCMVRASTAEDVRGLQEKG